MHFVPHMAAITRHYAAHKPARRPSPICFGMGTRLTSMSARLVYRYTDGTGRHINGSVVLRGNPSCHAARICSFLMDGKYFVPFQIAIPELYPFDPEDYPFAVPIDPVEHELLRIVPTDEAVTDLLDRDIEEFLDDLAHVAWDTTPFEPA